MRILSSALIASLLLNGIALPPESMASEEQQACATDTYNPDVKSTQEIPGKCGAGAYSSACKTTREYIFKESDNYKKLAEEMCKKHQAAVGEINNLNQSSSYDQVAAKADAGIKDIQSLLAKNKELRYGLPAKSEANVNALKTIANSPTNRAPGTFQKSVVRIGRDFTRAKHSPEALKDRARSGVLPSDGSDITGLNASLAPDAKAQLETLSQSQNFVRALLIDKEKNEKALSELQQAKSEAQKRANNTRTAQDDNSTKSSEKGFDPMSLLPLAAPLAGLLMQQQAQQDSGLSDTLTQPTDPYATGDTGPAPLAGTSLDPKTNQTPGSTPITAPKSQDTEMNMPVETYAGGAGAVEASSGGDISQGNSNGNGSPLNAGGSYSANSGGSSDSSGSSTAPGKGDRKPANQAAAAAGEEGLIGSGGGGGAFGGSSSTDTAAAEEGGMKDMLHDMEATLEDTPTGLFAEADMQGSADGVAPENSESLFPRVRACYVRNLKKGFVLNGLGEKLPESDSH